MATYSDINMLFKMHPSTADVIKVTDEDAIKASVVNLIQTRHYERPFHPEIGCQVWSLLFEPFSPVTRNIMQQTIRDVLDKFEPRITLKDVRVREYFDDNELDVTIEFIINSTDKLVSITTAISRVR